MDWQGAETSTIGVERVAQLFTRAAEQKSDKKMLLHASWT
jgi:hypothetical protein